MSETRESGGVEPLLHFQQALAKGLFLIQQCKECGRHVFYPRAVCPHCGEPELKWVEATGRGVVHSTSVVHQKPEAGGDYNVSVIELDEGPRLMSRVMDVDPDKVKVGMIVSAHIGLIDGHDTVVFYNKEQGMKEW